MGWFFGSYCGCASCPKFSPPLGDELVQEYGSARWGNTKEFSSPLGVGLVQYALSITLEELLFSSPSGDGLVQCRYGSLG